MANEEKKNKLNIELPEDMSAGVYSNLAVITHSPTEFVADFIQIMPGMPKAKVRSRVIMTPQHAKRLLKALAGNIQRFEDNHGEISEISGPESIPLAFGGPQGEA
ncbi:MAG: hypothetical protein COA49_07085 [Bacteroidetes bacterium]|nr:MAG: hypothetical protein COA49_07085 [Bacteroidota bacterium]